MLGLVPLLPRQFDKLIGKSEAMRKKNKRDGDLRPLIKSQQKADGLWRDQILLWGDAIILEAVDQLVQAGAPRRAVRHAMRDIQLSIIDAFNALDAGQEAVLSFAHDGKHYVAFADADIPRAVKLVTDHFAKRGGPNGERVAVFCVPLHKAYEVVRARAAKHKIIFPDRVWPTPNETDLLAVAIGPRTAPIITEWQKRRAGKAGHQHQPT